LQAGARELSYSSTPPQNSKSLIPRIENFLIHCRDDRFASLLHWSAGQRRRFFLFRSAFLEGGTLHIPNSLLAPAYMAIALPENSPPKKPIDRAPMRITGSPEWRPLEKRYFGK
jgi:hypothetical protein